MNKRTTIGLPIIPLSIPAEVLGDEGWEKVREVYRAEMEEDVKGGKGSGHRGHRGRPGQRGGSMPGGVPSWYGQAKALTGEEQWDANGRLVRHIVSSGDNPDLYIGDPKLAGDYVRGQVKRDIINVLTNRVMDEIPIEEMSSEEAEAAVDVWLEEKNQVHRDMNQFISQWAHTSSDEDMRSLAIQRDAAEEFGVPISDFMQGQFDKVEQNYQDSVEGWENWNEYLDMSDDEIAQDHRIMSLAMSMGSDWIKAHYNGEVRTEGAIAWVRGQADKWAYTHPSEEPEYNPLFPSDRQRRFLRAMYDETQEQLSAFFKPGERILLHRGISLPSGDLPDGIGRRGEGNRGIIDFIGNPIESWTTSYDSAANFAWNREERGQHGVVLTISVPIEAILSTCRTGFGCLTEVEVTLLGCAGQAYVEWPIGRDDD